MTETGFAFAEKEAKRLLGSELDAEKRDGEQLLKQAKARHAAMSPKGSLGLPPLLEERRWQYQITDGAFDMQPVFDRVLVKQVAVYTRTAASGLLVMPDQTKRREYESSPRGVIVSAGWTALDQLNSNGISLGHMVALLRHVPYRFRHDVIDGKDEHLLVIQVGDIIGSFDLMENLRSRKCRVRFDEENEQHQLIDENGKAWNPASADIPADY